jgi:hypothetical protein
MRLKSATVKRRRSNTPAPKMKRKKPLGVKKFSRLIGIIYPKQNA